MKYALALAVIILSVTTSTYAADPKKGGPMGGFAVKVVAYTVTPQLVEEKIAVTGSLAANEAVDIKSEIDGNVKEIKFEEGQRVTKDQELLVLDREKLEASLNQAKASLTIAQATFDRMKSLVESGAVSRQEFDQAQSTLNQNQAQIELLQAQLNDTVIKAPFAGITGERKVSPGQVIAKDMSLTYLIDDNPMKVEFRAPERYLNRLAVGQTINLKVAAYMDKTFQGEVYFINPQVDDVTRTALVKAKVVNSDGELRQGMFAKIELVIDQKPDALVIPESALMSNGDSVMVFTIDAENKAQMAMVKTGVREQGFIEITDGLKAGDRVITEGFQKIGPGSMVDPIDPQATEKKQ